jgi:branched-chain amino acid transport system permease protein
MLADRRFAGIAVAVLIAAALLPFVLPTYETNLAIEVLIFALLAMSIDLLAGYAGRTSLGHGAIFGIATYVAIYCATQQGVPALAAFILGVIGATLLAALFGLLATRTSGVYFLLLTLALGMIVWGVCLRWTTVTGGENGMRGTIRPEFLADRAHLYWFTLAITAAAVFLMWRFVHSAFGLTLRGIRDSNSRMRALGYDVSLHLLLGFTISGFFAGVAGALYAFFNDFVSPTAVALPQSVSGLLMAIVGGIGTLFGGLIGSAVLVLLRDVVSSYTERWQSVLGLTFILIMILLPEGIIGGLRRLTARRTKGVQT